MRKLSLLVAVTLFALAGYARAQDETPAPDPAEGVADEAAPDTEEAPPPAAAEAPGSKIRIGLAFLPMLGGTGGGGEKADLSWVDLATAYGVGVSFGYKVIAGLSVGLAPQLLLNVKAKDDFYDASKEIDIMARIAYEHTVIPKLDVYLEVLPGYSFIQFASGRSYMGEAPPNPKGFVFAVGGGAAYDVTDQFFANLGVGYQMGFGGFSVGGTDYGFRTKFYRLLLGGGVKL